MSKDDSMSNLETEVQGAIWRQVREIVADALDLPLPVRKDFVHRECKGDDALLLRVLELLERADGDRDFMPSHEEAAGHATDSWPGSCVSGEPTAAASKQASTRDLGSRIGDSLSSFEVLEILGKGGMGEVYRARSTRGTYEQDVAIKVLDASATGRDLVHRLQREGGVLSSLIHAYIVRYLESGEAPGGQPFVVMELAEGCHIDKYCDDHEMPLQQRIELFLKVCEAVHFAHLKLVVHCDLKPSNILITPEGHPRLLDFGIAHRWAEDQAVFAEEALPFTPFYASPEQMQGLSPTQGVDVYALGLLLYELLTGQRGHRSGADDSFMEVQRVVCDQVPELASRAVLCSGEEGGRDPVGWSRLLRGDLDSILSTALEKNPDQRYATVAELIDDLRNYLARRPVRARPLTLRYRAGKFIERHRFGVIGAAIVTVLLGIASTGLVRQQLEIRSQNQQLVQKNAEVEEERDRANEVTDFLVDFLRLPDPLHRAGGASLTVKEAFDSAAFNLRTRLRDRPVLRAELLDVVGRIYTNLALYEGAERWLNESLETRRGEFGGDHPLVASSLHNLAYLRTQQGQLDAAEILRRAAIAIQRPAFPGGDVSLARGLNGLASLLRQRRQFVEAETTARDALEMQVRLLGVNDLDVARTLNTLASVCRQSGKPEEAAELYLRSLDIRRDFSGPDGAGVAAVLNNLALTLIELGRLSEAIDMHREALEIREQSLPVGHPQRITSLNNLSLALSLNDEHGEAIVRSRQALDLHKRLESHPRRGLALRLNRASILERQGQADVCFTAIEPVLAEATEKGSPRQQADAQSIFGGCLTRVGRFAEAEPILVRSHRRLVELLGNRARQTRQAQERLENLSEFRGRTE